MQKLDQDLTPLVNEISGLIAEKLMVEAGAPEEDLLASGLLDSLSLIQLLTNLEEHFGIRVPLEDLQIDDVRSINSLARLVDRQSVHASVERATGTR